MGQKLSLPFMDKRLSHDGVCRRSNAGIGRHSLRCWVLHPPQFKDKGMVASYCLPKVNRCREGTSPRVMELKCHRFHSQVCLGVEV